jgi:hypothetical protein
MRLPKRQDWRREFAAPTAAQARPHLTGAQWSAPRRPGHCPTYAVERRHNRMAHLRRLWPLSGGTVQRWG